MQNQKMPISNDALAQAKKIADSDTGKKLFALLSQSDPSALQQAMEQAAAGNYQQVQKTVSQLMSSPEARALLEKMGGSGNG